MKTELANYLNTETEKLKATQKIEQAIHNWGKRYFRSYQWDSKKGFTAIGRTGTTFMYDAEYVVNKFKRKLSLTK